MKHLLKLEGMPKEDMLNMAKDPSKIGSIIVLDKCPYTLIGSFGISSDNNIL